MNLIYVDDTFSESCTENWPPEIYGYTICLLCANLFPEKYFVHFCVFFSMFARAEANGCRNMDIASKKKFVIRKRSFFVRFRHVIRCIFHENCSAPIEFIEAMVTGVCVCV